MRTMFRRKFFVLWACMAILLGIAIGRFICGEWRDALYVFLLAVPCPIFVVLLNIIDNEHERAEGWKHSALAFLRLFQQTKEEAELAELEQKKADNSKNE